MANPFYPLLSGTNLAATTVALSQLLKPYSQFSGVTETSDGGSSWYHALQTRTEKRFSTGLYASLFVHVVEVMQAISYLNPTDTRPEHVISDQDRPFRSVVTWVYELPFGAGKPWANWSNPVLAHAISGWQMQGVFTYQSGQALGFGNAILLCNPSQIALSQQNIHQWFNTSCFNTASSQQLASNVSRIESVFGNSWARRE